MLTRLQPFRRVSATAAPRRMFRTSVAADARVLCSDPINAVAVDILQRRGHDVTTPAANKPLTPEELKLAIPEFDALVVRSGTTVTPEVLEHAERLKFIGRAGTGVNNIDIPAATSRGVVVMNTPGGNTTSAVELTISLMFALARHIPQAATLLKDGVWDRASFKGSELAGKTIGIVGLGLIGREVAAICQKFEMRTVAYDPVMSPDVAARSGIQLMPLKSLFLEADFLTVHTPLNEATKDLIDAHALNSCKTGVKVINTARGGIINEQALLDALKSGQVSGAALDVFTTEPPTNPAALELIDHPNVICTPHLGASTKDAQFRVAKDIAEYLADALDGVKYSGVVNASGLEMQSNEKLRPWVELADRIGLLEAGLLSTSRISQVSIAIRGPTISDPKIAQVLRRAVLRGIMDKISNVPVNLVNAPTLVENIGLQVLSSVQTEPDFDHRNVIAVTLTSIDGESVSFSGTLIRGEPTLVRFHNHDINIHPDGRMLLVRNEDRPGVVYRVSQLLGSDLVNVNEMSLALHEQEAFSVYNIDNKVSTDMLERLRAIPGVRAVQESFVESTFSKAKEIIPKAPVKVAVALADQRPPATRPSNPCFGSGPTTKRPGWSLDALSGAALGRSHRSSLGKGKLAEAIDRTKDILNVPSDYHVGIVPASDTGAFEMAMWTMLGQQPVDVAHWESFGKGWYTDATTHLQLDDVHEYSAPYGELPEMPSNPDHDVLFTWNGTTSGVRVPNADWLATGSGKGLAFCDATSAVFAQQVPLDKLDVVTYSWQKVLGGEGAHGMLILSPKAVDRLESYVPPRPLPKIFRLAKKGKLDAAIFKGSTINTPSMLCVEDYLDSLKWAEELGGLDVLCRRADRNLAVVESFVGDREWISFLAADPATRSNTSVCLTVDLPDDKLKLMLQLLDTAGVAYDIGAYRDAPAGLRIWCGATVREQDLAQLMPWLEWAYHQALTA